MNTRSKFLFVSFILVAIFLFFYFLGSFSKKPLSKESTIDMSVSPEVSSGSKVLNRRMVIRVPYVSEAPEGDWSGDWINACEEATIAMVSEYYKGTQYVSVALAKEILTNLFVEENKLFGSNKNTNAAQIKELVDLFFDFNVWIVQNPSIDAIKREIDNDRPVISLHRGFDLNNPNVPFSPQLSSYHTIVVVGYDDSKKSFIAHDPGDEKTGEYIYYSYDTFFNSLHDYNAEENKTDGTPTVLFTNNK